MGKTTISWCDFTFNPWVGCTKVSDGCKFCYAEALMDKRWGKVEWGPKGERKRTSPANWREPLKWARDAKAAGERRRVFCASLADVFEGRPELDEWLVDLLLLIDATQELDWLLLTKRPENIPKLLPTSFQRYPRKNVWLGTSVENQATADERIPHLLKCPARVRFLSCEPLLGEIAIRPYTLTERPCFVCRSEDACGQTRGSMSHPINCGWRHDQERAGTFRRLESPGSGIDWVIVGGESGGSARPCVIGHVRQLVHQCQDAGVAVFVKQLGANPTNREGVSHPLKDSKGGDIIEFPVDLRIREMPLVKGGG